MQNAPKATLFKSEEQRDEIEDHFTPRKNMGVSLRATNLLAKCLNYTEFLFCILKVWKSGAKHTEGQAWNLQEKCAR